jgi:two-component system, NtrC family, sensor kinase
MAALPTLRRELIGAFAFVFAGALFVAVTGVLLAVPRLEPLPAVAYVFILLFADIALFLFFGIKLLRRRVLEPLEGMVQGVETVSRGDFTTRLPPGDTAELSRLSTAVNQMAERLITDQQKLAENIKSLNETNRLLTEARDAMIHTEKLASVGRLSAGVAHEVGNPLGAIIGYLSLLGRHVNTSHRDLLTAAEREANRIDRIVRGLLDFARPRDTVTQTIEMNEVVRDTFELVQMQGHFTLINVQLELSAEDLMLRGNPYQMQQVFVNLFVNAADALADRKDGRIIVRSVRRPVIVRAAPSPARRKEDPPGIDYSHRRRLAATPRRPGGDPESESGDVIEVSVTDNGPGFPAELLPQIFEPFVTTKEPGKGTGLGLAVCARIIEVMGGTIEAENAVGGGAVFRVVLPAIHVKVGAT